MWMRMPERAAWRRHNRSRFAGGGSALEPMSPTERVCRVDMRVREFGAGRKVARHWPLPLEQVAMTEDDGSLTQPVPNASATEPAMEVHA